ncbi:MAG: hypothetical protein PHC71_02400 [Candidatus Omnitrophica bacterium]|nr:hypothetical protein [Candidatus Omnitrophota bacterium]
MRRADIFLWLILVLLAGFARMVFADSNVDGVISRPVIEYTSGDLRDPFGDLLQSAIEKEKREKEAEASREPVENENPDKQTIDLGQFKVQGVILGSKTSQVIINNKILGVGDAINGAEIVKIEKKGITLSIGGRTANLAAPGNESSLRKIKGNKEE